jgi:hypothetical protein
MFGATNNRTPAGAASKHKSAKAQRGQRPASFSSSDQDGGSRTTPSTGITDMASSSTRRIGWPSELAENQTLGAVHARPFCINREYFSVVRPIFYTYLSYIHFQKEGRALRMHMLLWLSEDRRRGATAKCMIWQERSALAARELDGNRA